MSLKNGRVASTRFGQIKRKLGWNTSDVTSGRATVSTGFNGFNSLTAIKKVTKKKAAAAGSARVKRARKAPAYEEDSLDDEVCRGDAKAKGDHSDESKQGDEGKRYVTTAQHSFKFLDNGIDKKSQASSTCWLQWKRR